MNCYIVTSLTHKGVTVSTRHYSILRARAEQEFRRLNGHTSVTIQTYTHDVIYAG